MKWIWHVDSIMPNLSLFSHNLCEHCNWLWHFWQNHLYCTTKLRGPIERDRCEVKLYQGIIFTKNFVFGICQILMFFVKVTSWSHFLLEREQAYRRQSFLQTWVGHNIKIRRKVNFQGKIYTQISFMDLQQAHL